MASLISARTHVPSWPIDLDTIGARQIADQAARHEVERQKVRNLLGRRSDTGQIAEMLGLVDAH